MGDPVSIRLTFDPSIPAVIGVAAYDYIQFGATVGTYTATYVPDVSHISEITALNNSNSGLGMADGFGATGFDQSAGPPVSGLLLQSAFVSVFDFAQTIFNDTILPSSLNLADACAHPARRTHSFSALRSEITARSSL